MPFKSKAQQRFMFAAEAKGELKPGTARKWAHETKDIKALPDHVKRAFMIGVVNELNKLATYKSPKDAPDFKTMKANRVKLTPEERALVMERKAVWHFNHAGPSPAVWKSVVNGKAWFVTNTHRAYNVCPTVNGAIGRYHAFIKSTA